MTLTEFIVKWRKAELTERSAAQQHFLDLCDVFGHPKPAAVDPTGETFTFEKGAAKHGGGDGWADVWKRGFFAFEYGSCGVTGGSLGLSRYRGGGPGLASPCRAEICGGMTPSPTGATLGSTTS